MSEDLTKFVSEEAEKIAKEWSESRATKGQVRKFYSELKRLEYLMNISGSREDKFKEMLPNIKLFISKVSYDKNRSVLKNEVAEWLQKGLRQINTISDFDVFIIKYEAILGFFKENHGGSQKSNYEQQGSKNQNYNSFNRGGRR